MCVEILQTPAFPTPNVGGDEKRAFLVEMAGTRQYAKFKDVVRRFSAKNRGHEL